MIEDLRITNGIEKNLASIRSLLISSPFKPFRFVSKDGGFDLINYWMAYIGNLTKENNAKSFVASGGGTVVGLLIYSDNAWETNILGYKVATINTFVIDQSNGNKHEIVHTLLDQLIKHARQNSIKLISCKIFTDDLLLIHAIEHNGFFLMDTVVDCGFDYQRSPFPSIQKPVVDNEVTFRPANPADREELISVAGKAFNLHFGRFHSDDRIGRKSARKIYEQWISSSMDGYADWMYLAEVEGRIAGFSIWKKPSLVEKLLPIRLSHYSIAGIHPDFHGRGLFTGLTYQGMKTLDGSFDMIEGPTHINNYGVQAGYSKLGWRILYDARHTFHLWID